MLRFTGCSVDDDSTTGHYEAADAGDAKSPAVSYPVTLVTSKSGAKVMLDFAAQGDTEELALEAAAAQLETMARLIRSRGEVAYALPIYG